MGHSAIGQLIQQFEQGKLSRRELGKRAAAIGVSAGALTLGISIGSDELLARKAAAEQAVAEGWVTANNEQMPSYQKNFNPLGPAGGSVRWFTVSGMYEPLMVWDVQTAKLIPWLAESYEWSKDNLKLTFKLRDGVKWSDGQPFTAKDVAFTWNLFFKNEGLGGNGARTVINADDPVVTEVKAVDNLTAEWTFKRPYTIGIYDIAGQVIVPEHAWKDVKDPVKFTNENPVGTGAFTVVKKFEPQIYELGKNPTYWQPGKPYVEGFRFPAYSSNDQISLAMMNGELDWNANFMPDIENTYIAKDKDHNHYWFPPTGADVMLYANHTVKPLDDPNVRKAISMAINREQICTVAMFDYTHPSDPTGMSDAFESAKDEQAKNAGWTTYNKDEANKLLDAAGCKKNGEFRSSPDGKPMDYDILVVSGWSDWVQSCDIIASSLKDVGIKAQVKPFDYNTWIEKVQNGDFAMSIGWSSQGQTPFNFYRGVMSSLTWHAVGTSSGENWHRAKYPEADKALNDFASTADEAKQKELSVTLQRLFAEKAPAIPLFPGPQWGEYTTYRFDGFPNKDNPYCTLSTWSGESVILMNAIYPINSTGEHTHEVIPPAGGSASPAATPKS